MTDERLLELYMQGFRDELNGQKIDTKDSAYNLGALHAILGDEVTSIDYLSDEQILEKIKKEK